MLNLRQQTAAALVRVAGTNLSAAVDLLKGVKKHRIYLQIIADVTITGAAGGTVNPEGILRLIDEIRMLENGRPTVQVSGQALGYLTARNSRGVPNIGALASAAAQTNTIIRADLVLDFAEISGAIPAETAYVERDARFPTQLQAQWAADPQAALISGTGLTLNSLQIVPVEEFDPTSLQMPFFLPRIKRSQSPAITGPQASFTQLLYPEGSNRVARHLFHARSNGATTDGAFTGQVTIRGDKTRYLDTVDFRTVLAMRRYECENPVQRAGYLEFNWRKYGKLSECYFAGQDNNLRLEAAVTNPGGTTVLDVYSVELEPVPGYTADLPQGW